MSLRKTSVQLDTEQISKLQTLYPNHTPSQLIRLSLQYVLERRPQIRKAGFEREEGETREEREKQMRRSKVILKPTSNRSKP